jgi:hypothetical protein
MIVVTVEIAGLRDAAGNRPADAIGDRTSAPFSPCPHGNHPKELEPDTATVTPPIIQTDRLRLAEERLGPPDRAAQSRSNNATLYASSPKALLYATPW